MTKVSAMARGNLIDALRRQALLCDGAMGTQLMAAGMKPGECAEQWNIDRAAAVRDIHSRYRAAGCDLLTTNTFGGSAASLDKHGLSAAVGELNEAGARLARQAAGDDAWVLGDIGPFGGFLEPLGDMVEDRLLAIFTEQAQALRRGGADAVIVETMVDPNEMAVAIRAARAAGDWPVIATYAFEPPVGGIFRTMMGATVDDAVAAAADAGAAVVGANCGTRLDMNAYVNLARAIVRAAAPRKLLSIIQPNAGAPVMVDDKLVHPATPDEMAAIVPTLIDVGINIIGGCCGTTPQHLAAMRKALARKSQ